MSKNEAMCNNVKDTGKKYETHEEREVQKMHGKLRHQLKSVSPQKAILSLVSAN